MESATRGVGPQIGRRLQREQTFEGALRGLRDIRGALLAADTKEDLLARDLGEQIRRALSSVALNIGEGSGNEGGTRIARYSTAAGSNAEVRAALRVAVAWGYVSGTQVEAGEQLLDRIAALLYRLGARR